MSFYFLAKEFLTYKQSNDSNMQLIKEVVKEDTLAEEKSSKEKKEIQIDWKRLESINKDIIGWIRIEETNINYPVLKDSHRLKYLSYTYNGKYNTNGSIFTLNNKPFEDNITMIYGHNTRNGLMFSHLDKYMEQEFFREHFNFNLYTKKQEYKATIFSCYSIGIDTEEDNIKSLDFKEEIAYYKKQSKYVVKDIGKIEKVVKLSTCSYRNNHTVPTNQRYYIVAKLEEIEKRKI